VIDQLGLATGSSGVRLGAVGDGIFEAIQLLGGQAVNG
jgi:hypothetical protein